jgi:hypothetical protein
LGVTLIAAPAEAQTPELSSAGPCQVSFVPRAAKEERRDVNQLYARCGGKGVLLGFATSFEAFANDPFRATLVDVRTRAERHILLLTLQDDGFTLIEDLTGQIARAAGRGPFSNIDGIALDFKQFTRSGDLGVLAASEDRGRARSDHISIGEQVVAERARRSAIKTN